MAHTAGRPHDPTLHPRTRPEANEYALRNRGTSDWYRHDGKNIEEPAPPHIRLATEGAQEIAEKSKGEADKWFKHDSNNETDVAPVPRLPTEEAKDAQEKVYGKEEKWMSQDDNKDYFSPRGQQRLPDHGPSITFKEKFTTQNTMNWYRHEEGPKPQVSDNTPSKSKTPARKQLQEHPMSGTWFSHDASNALPDARPVSRTSHNVDAEGYLARNRQGSAQSWYGHDSSKQEIQEANGARVTSIEGGAIAKKLGRESENWYSHDANKGYNDPTPVKKGSAESQSMVERARGGEMALTLKMEPKSNGATPDACVPPDANETAEKSRQGLMDKYLQQNKDYNSPIPEPRVKPEASEFAEKNKGDMGNFMQGYPDPPTKKDGPRIKQDAADNAAKNRGTAGILISNEKPASPQNANAAYDQSEACRNANRNKGTLGSLMENYGNMQMSDRPAARLQNDAARENAARNQGVHNLIS